MAMRHELDAIRELHPIVDVLERLGCPPPAWWNGSSDFMIGCPSPVHDDRTPSCIVHPASERFHCFGCGVHGDVFDLVQQVAGLPSLGEAIAYLDGGAQLSVTRTTPPMRPRQPTVIDPHRPVLDRTPIDRILEVNSAAWNELTTPPARATARRYLAGRGIDVAPLEEGEDRPLVGYTPAQPAGLTQRLRSCGFTEAEIIDAGWAVRRDQQAHDRFHRRVIFPISDGDGCLVGVTARDITGTARAKYINTPTTAAFRKGDCLYIPLHAPSPPAGPIVICEGPIDALVLAANQGATAYSGGAVALCGTAMTRRHVTLIARLGTRSVVVWADGDPAGHEAARRWLEQLKSAGLEAHLHVLPNGQDPASWLGHRPVRSLGTRTIAL